eukprot:COSAG01_NODE_1437_length_10311_cov_11.678613_2_plen_70_part_00
MSSVVTAAQVLSMCNVLPRDAGTERVAGDDKPGPGAYNVPTFNGPGGASAAHGRRSLVSRRLPKRVRGS